MATFTWAADHGATNTKQPKLIKADFGDGYTQTTLDGINSNPNDWDVSFTRATSIITTIREFLDDNAGVSFDWTDPDGNSGKYRCEQWDHEKINDNVGKINATFVESFI